MAGPALARFFSFRTDLASRAAALSFASNASLMALKMTVGILTGSVAVLSDGIDSAEDSLASIFAFVSIRLSSQPADRSHPYGHGKAESIAAAAQALLIAGGGGFIVFTATRRLIDRDVDIDAGPGIIALVITALVNLAVVLYVGRAARITGSVALKADTRHLYANIAQAGAVTLALALVAITDRTIFDPIVALALAAWLFWTAGQVAGGALSEIMDARLPADEERVIERCLQARRSDGIRGFHDLRTRRAGRQRYVDVHVVVDPERSVANAHALCDEVEREIASELQGAVVTIHLDPDDGSDATPPERRA